LSSGHGPGRAEEQPAAVGLGGQRALSEKAAPTARLEPENAKSPAERGFSECAEEDSNLHPVIPDQALKTVGA
jgi:hypothetical protein